ncbi:low temperature requirement protein A [Aeromicrobium sp. 179-A 4D2 NHS]|uniref:low temperature requirement protein A n=1 Tax=Aeromicrobium sp. 179-A 4D2 NHS TaxID=3142375 RepID=UPI0039A18583
MIRPVRRSADVQGQRATTLELFYDLVFVFAITRVSHSLLEHLTWVGVGQSVLVLLAVWWSWNYTTWATNELDAESVPVRLLLMWLMLASLLMAIAIPEAFGERGLLFAAAYLAIQVSRHAFVAFAAADRGTPERERAARILTWFLFAGVFWIAGGLAEGEMRVALWIVALALDYGAPLVFFWLPRRPHLGGRTWQVETGHFAERFGLFVIIALGETIITTGATTAELPLDGPTVLAFCLAFAGTAALWWLYFASIAELAEHALDEESTRTAMARDVYTYGHVLIVASIILAALGDELVIAHPTHHLSTTHLWVAAGGPALYLLSQAALRFRMARTVSVRSLAGVLGCLLVAVAGGHLPAVVVSALLVAILVAVVVADLRDTRGAGKAVRA